LLTGRTVVRTLAASSASHSRSCWWPSEGKALDAVRNATGAARARRGVRAAGGRGGIPPVS
jgi:hypothetical protein